MPDKLILEVISPEKILLSAETDSLVVPASEGYLGILPKHAPLITGLTAGVVRYKVDGQETKLAISGGFMEVYENKATILADTAELATDIDEARALRAKERAENRLRAKDSDLDIVRAELALKRALARINAIR